MSGKILVVDDVATNRIVMKVKLASACYTVLQAQGGRQALIRARREQPDLILLDVMMPDLDGFAVCRALKSDPSTAHIPIIMVTAMADREARLQGLKAGADDFLTKPLDEVTLLARVRSLIRSLGSADDRRAMDRNRRALGLVKADADRERPAPDLPGQRIGLVCPTPAAALHMMRQLRSRLPGPEIERLSREAALGSSKEQPDLFVIEAGADDPEAALQILAELRARPATRYAGLVLILPQKASAAAAQALDQGANEVIFQPLEIEELAFRLATQLRAKHAADQRRAEVEAGLRLAVIDPLTGLFNRRYAMGHLENIASRAQRTGRDFAVIMLDFDHFKQVNDTHGHLVGDQVLAEIAMRLREKLRAMDLIARLGGEEFLIVLPDTGQAQAERIAERIRRLIESTPVSIAPVALAQAPAPVPVTVSLGLAMARAQGKQIDTAALLDGADRALYVAKSQGRNTVRVTPTLDVA